jgi:hypothetical protein
MKSTVERPCCQQVCHADIRTASARALAQVQLPPQTLRKMTPKGSLSRHHRFC